MEQKINIIHGYLVMDQRKGLIRGDFGISYIDKKPMKIKFGKKLNIF